MCTVSTSTDVGRLEPDRGRRNTGKGVVGDGEGTGYFYFSPSHEKFFEVRS